MLCICSTTLSHCVGNRLDEAFGCRAGSLCFELGSADHTEAPAMSAVNRYLFVIFGNCKVRVTQLIKIFTRVFIDHPVLKL